MNPATINILRLDASANTSSSNSMKLGDRLIAKLRDQNEVNLNQRNLNEGLSLIDDNWVAANFTPPEDRTDLQKQTLEFSDRLIDELQQADT